MGMPIVIDIPAAKVAVEFELFFDEFRRIDNRFSTYKPESEVSRFARGELKEKQLSRELKTVIKNCRHAQKTTDGVFSAWAGGIFDPSGYVKAWAIDKVARLIKKAGYKTYCIYAGGDILARSDGSKDWTIGIQDPRDKRGLIGKISGQNFAVATSGSYERGHHIVDPKSGNAVTKLLSFTVMGANIIEADILATAGFVLGDFGVNFVAGKRGYAAAAVDKEGRLSMSSSMRSIWRPL